MVVVLLERLIACGNASRSLYFVADCGSREGQDQGGGGGLGVGDILECLGYFRAVMEGPVRLRQEWNRSEIRGRTIRNILIRFFCLSTRSERPHLCWNVILRSSIIVLFLFLCVFFCPPRFAVFCGRQTHFLLFVSPVGVKL